MPRNASGNYSLVAGNPVAPDTLIEVNWANPTLADIAQALTDSLDRYGRGSMVGSMKFPDGSVAAPAIAFAAESTTGFYRAAGKVLSASVNNSEILRLEPLKVSLKSGAVDMVVVEPTRVTITPPTTFTGDTTFTGAPSWVTAPTAAEHLANKSYVDAQFSSAAGGGYLPLAGGTLTGNLIIVRNQNAVLTLNTPDAAANRKNGAVYMSSNGVLNLVTTNDAGSVEQVAFRINPDGNCYTVTGAKFWHAGNDGAGSGLDADLLGGKAWSAANVANTHVTRDVNGQIRVTTIDIAGVVLSNESSKLRTASQIYASGRIRSDDSLEVNGITLLNNSGWWSTAYPFQSDWAIRGNDIIANGGRHYGGWIRNASTCTLGGDNGHAFGFFWDGTNFAVCINNNTNKGFDTWAYSDSRIKTDVQSSRVNALETLRGLGIQEFNIDPKMAKLLGEPEHHRIGMMADEVQDVIPEAVVVLSPGENLNPEVPRDLKQLRYTALIPWIIKALQQLADDVDALAA